MLKKQQTNKQPKKIKRTAATTKTLIFFTIIATRLKPVMAAALAPGCVRNFAQQCTALCAPRMGRPMETTVDDDAGTWSYI